MNKRIYVEKKEDFAVEGLKIKDDLVKNLKLNKLEKVRLINIYDIFNMEREDIEIFKKVVLSEEVVDEVYEEIKLEDKKYIAVEYLAGQFDQRADSAMQCVNIVCKKSKNTVVKTGKILILEGDVTNDEIEKIKGYYINKVEMQEKNLNEMELRENLLPEKIKRHIGFIEKDNEELQKFVEENKLAMGIEDIKHIKKYFKEVERREPSDTEIKVLDTYWSDHCRHTTFETVLKTIKFEEGKFKETIQKGYEKYLKTRKQVHGENINNKPITLMDMAVITAKKMRKEGKLDDVEISEEINACSVFIDVDVKKGEEIKTEKYLLMFKNETHNHPTEIEPFGGASTCIGGAIRDPLSGRSYVYQGIRITGGSNPLESVEETLEGKLSQKK